MSSRNTVRGQQYGNDGPKNFDFKNAVPGYTKLFELFSRQRKADVTTAKPCVNKRFFFRNIPTFVNFSLAN